MTMLAAAAMAFGLFAEPFEKKWSAETASDLTGWSGATDKAKLEGGVLKIATGSDLLTRAVNDAAPFTVSENFYFDTSLNMLGQALDELPTVTNDAKLALFVLDSSEIEGAPKATNFYAIAENPTQNGKWLYELGVDLEDVNAGARFTVKAYKNVLASGERAGFKLFLNGDEAEETADLVEVVGAYPIEDGAVIWSQHKSSTDLENAYLRNLVAPTLKKNHRAVLLSLQETAGAVTVSSMDFAGNAEISTVNFNDFGYNFIASDADVMTIASETTGLTIADVKVGDESVLSDGVITAEEGDTLVVTLNGTFDIVEWSLNGETQEVKGNTFEVDFDKDGVITVSGSAAGAEIDGKKFKTLQAALDALAAGEAEGDIKLLATADLGADLTIAVSSDATIDLNGQTITGAGNPDGGNAVIELGGGTLTIKDSSDAKTGKILPVGNGVLAVSITDGKLVIEGGIFDGAIDGATEGTAEITGGKFKSADDAAFYLAACMDETTYKATYAEPYWTVAEIVFYTVTVDDSIEHGMVSVDKDEAEEGVTVTVTATPADDYKLGAITVMQEETPVTVTGNTFVMPAGDVTVSATFIAKEYVAQIGDDETKKYETIEEAFAALPESDGTIKMIADYDYSAQITLEGAKSFTLDLNGTTLNDKQGGSNYSLWLKGASMTLVDTATTKGVFKRTDCDGKCTMIRVGFEGNITTNEQGEVVSREGELTSKFVIDGATIQHNPGNASMVKVEWGSFEMNSGAIDCAKAGATNIALSVRWNNKAEIKGGDVLGKFEFKDGAKSTQLTIDADAVATAESQFVIDPTEWLDDANYEAKQDETSGLWTVVEKQTDPIIDPDGNADVPSTITDKAEAEAWAKDHVKVQTPDDKIISTDDYTAYFNHVVSGDAGAFQVSAELKPEIVKAEKETEEVLEEVLKLADDGEITITSAKPGLYYSLPQGEELGDRTESARVQAESATVKLEAGKWANSGFYQIQVNTKAE